MHPILKILTNITQVEISEQDRTFLAKLKDKRLLILGNHPSTSEPPLVFYISYIIGQPLEFMASRQVFAWAGGVIGALIRRLGAFSIIAGTNDKPSFRYAREVLERKEGKLVIFPEGEPTSGENSTLMPFQGGFTLIGTQALENIMKEDDGDILVVPLSFFYSYNCEKAQMQKTLLKKLASIEKKLNVKNDEHDFVERLIRIGRLLLVKYEKHYDVIPEEGQDIKYRVGRLRHSLLNRLAETYRVTFPDEEENAIMKFRKIFTRAELYLCGHKDPALPKIPKKTHRKSFLELVRVFEMIVFNEEHLTTNPTYEKCFEWIDRYETLLEMNKPRALGGSPSVLPRTATIRLGEPFALSGYLSTDRKKRKEMMSQLTDRIANELDRLLKGCENLAHPS